MLVPIQPKILHIVSVGEYLFSFLPLPHKQSRWNLQGSDMVRWKLPVDPATNTYAAASSLLAIRKSLASAFGRQVPCWGEGNSSPALCWALRPHCGPRSLLPRGEQLLYQGMGQRNHFPPSYILRDANKQKWGDKKQKRIIKIHVVHKCLFL